MRRLSAVQLTLIIAGAALLAAGAMMSRPTSAHPDTLGVLALALTVVMAAAIVGGHVAVRIGQAAVLGELLAGMLLGVTAELLGLQFIATDPYLDILARIGMLLLLFEVGVGLSVRELFAVGPSSLLVAVIGTVASLAIGTAAADLSMPAASTATHVFIGAALTATSVGITARVLKDMGASRDIESRVILGAAVVDDVLGLILFGIIAGTFAPGGTANGRGAAAIAALLMKTVGFLALALVLGTRLTPGWFRRAARLRTEGALLAVGLCFCFFVSWAASGIGLAALVGAFAAGLVLEDAHSELFVRRGEPALDELLRPMTSFLVPVFFVLVGVRADLRALVHPAAFGVALVLAAAAVLGKLACGLGVLTPGASRLTVAVGMIPRGEVALVFAALGGTFRSGTAPLLDTGGYTAIVAVVVLTTLVTPPALKWSLGRAARHRVQPRPAA